jgi:hypothetical protein
MLQSIRCRLALLLCVALILAQWGALLHAHSHDREIPGQAMQQDKAVVHTVCDLCQSFGSVLTPAAGSPIASILVVFHGGTARAILASLISHQTLLAFRSRAPPQIASFR